MSGSLFFSTFRGQKNILCNFLVQLLKYFLKSFKFFFAHKKLKNTLKSCSENSNPRFFSLLPELPKRPKQKDLCSKMWLIDQLFIELGQKITKSNKNNLLFHGYKCGIHCFIFDWIAFFINPKTKNAVNWKYWPNSNFKTNWKLALEIVLYFIHLSFSRWGK